MIGSYTSFAYLVMLGKPKSIPFSCLNDTPNFFWGGGGPIKKHPVCLVLCTKRKNSDTHSGHRLWKAFNCGQEPNIRCFVAKAGFSRVTRAMRGGSQKVTNDDEGEGGVTIPPKIDDVIYEQPLNNSNDYTGL